MATSQTMEDQITCSICSDHITKPKGLPFCHAFCEHCFTECFLSQLTEKTDVRTIACPLCRRDVSSPYASTPTSKWTGQFPTNHYVTNWRDIRITSAQIKPSLTAGHYSKNLAIPLSLQLANIFKTSDQTIVKSASCFSDGNIAILREDRRQTPCEDLYHSTTDPRMSLDIYSQSGKWLDTKRLGSERYDIAATAGNILAVTRVGGSIERYLYKEDETSYSVLLEEVIKLHDKCYGITGIGNRGMIVVCDGDPTYIKILKQDGTPYFMFQAKQGKVGPTGETYVATNAKASCIVVTDCKQDMVFCYSSEGVLRWTSPVPGASGVVLVDPYILVASKTGGVVLALDMFGNIVKTLIDGKDGIRCPRVLALSLNEELLLVDEGGDVVRVFEVMHEPRKPLAVNRCRILLSACIHVPSAGMKHKIAGD